MKTKISEMKSIPDMIKSRLDIAEDNINKPEDTAIKTIQHEKQEENLFTEINEQSQ